MTALLAGSPTRRSRAYYAAVAAGFFVFGAVAGLVVWKLLTAGAFAYSGPPFLQRRCSMWSGKKPLTQSA